MPAPDPAAPSIPSVSALTREIRGSLEGGFRDVWVEGEISNYRPHASGHRYFTLKDAKAQLSCVMFRGQASSLPAPLKDGLLVQARGDITVYEARGQYQLVARWIQPRGFGELQARFEALKRLLDAEGLFDPAAKKPLPGFPRVVALVTSPTGAAVRDMLAILKRRAPWLRVLLWPVRVQGEGAAAEIAGALEHVSRCSGAAGFPVIDAVIVGRGGGSIEDLWSFNEEIVARAIHACPLPVISAVGHEIDFTIADLAADLRAPTPSAAAELLAPDGAELRRGLEQALARLDRGAGQALAGWSSHLDYHFRSLAAREPSRVIGDRLQDCDAWKDRLESGMGNRLELLASRCGEARRLMESRQPGPALERHSAQAEEWRQRLDRRAESQMARLGDSLRHARRVLDLLDPEAALRRGYSMTWDARGRAVTAMAQVSTGDKLRTRVSDGEFESVVA